jgi:hypothetical protein
MRDEMAAALLKVLPREHQRRQAREWVESGRCRRLSNNVAGTVLALASQDLKLTPEDQASECLAGQILRELDERQLRLDSDRLELRAAACRALLEPNGTHALTDIVKSVDDGSYSEFVGVVLPRLLAGAETPDGHRKVVLSMAIDTRLQAFAETYAAFLKQRPRDAFDQVDVAAIVFWLRLGESDSAWPLLKRLKKLAIEAMANRIGSMRGKTRLKADAYLNKLPALQEPGLKRALRSFLACADELRPSWFNRLLGRGRA